MNVLDTEREFLRGSPERDLSKNLIGEGARHDEGRMTGGTAIRQPVNTGCLTTIVDY
jgi:hypothetical protein